MAFSDVLEDTLLKNKTHFKKIISHFENIIEIIGLGLKEEMVIFLLRNHPKYEKYFLLIKVLERKGLKIHLKYEFSKRKRFSKNNVSFFSYFLSFEEFFSDFLRNLRNNLENLITETISLKRRKDTKKKVRKELDLMENLMRELEWRSKINLKERGLLGLERDLYDFEEIGGLEGYEPKVMFQDEFVENIILKVEKNDYLIQIGDSLRENVLLRRFLPKIKNGDNDARCGYYVENIKLERSSEDIKEVYINLVVNRYLDQFSLIELYEMYRADNNLDDTTKTRDKFDYPTRKEYRKKNLKKNDLIEKYGETIIIKVKKGESLEGIKIKDIYEPEIREIKGFYLTLYTISEEMKFAEYRVELKDIFDLLSESIFAYDLLSYGNFESISIIEEPELVIFFNVKGKRDYLHNPLGLKIVLREVQDLERIRYKFLVRNKRKIDFEHIENIEEYWKMFRFQYDEELIEREIFNKIERSSFYGDPPKKPKQMREKLYYLFASKSNAVSKLNNAQSPIYIDSFQPIYIIRDHIIFPFDFQFFISEYSPNILLKIKRKDKFEFTKNNKHILSKFLEILIKKGLGVFILKTNINYVIDYDNKVTELVILLEKSENIDEENYRKVLGELYESEREREDIRFEIETQIQTIFLEAEYENKTKVFEDVKTEIIKQTKYDFKIIVSFEFKALESLNESFIIDYRIGTKFFTIFFKTSSKKRERIFSHLRNTASLLSISQVFKKIIKNLYKFREKGNLITINADPVKVYYNNLWKEESEMVSSEIHNGEKVTNHRKLIREIGDEDEIIEEIFIDIQLSDKGLEHLKEIVGVTLLTDKDNSYELKTGDVIVDPKTETREWEIIKFEVVEEDSKKIDLINYYQEYNSIYVRIRDSYEKRKTFQLEKGKNIDGVIKFLDEKRVIWEGKRITKITMNTDNSKALVELDKEKIIFNVKDKIMFLEKDVEINLSENFECVGLYQYDPDAMESLESVLLIFWYEDDERGEEIQADFIRGEANRNRNSPIRSKEEVIEIISDQNYTSVIVKIKDQSHEFRVDEEYILYVDNDKQFKAILEDIYPDQTIIEKGKIVLDKDKDINLRKVKVGVRHLNKRILKKEEILKEWGKIKKRTKRMGEIQKDIEEKNKSYIGGYIIDLLEAIQKKEIETINKVEKIKKTDKVRSIINNLKPSDVKQLLKFLEIEDYLMFFLDENGDVVSWENLEEEIRDFLLENEKSIVEYEWREEIKKAKKTEKAKSQSPKKVPKKREMIKPKKKIISGDTQLYRIDDLVESNFQFIVRGIFDEDERKFTAIEKKMFRLLKKDYDLELEMKETEARYYLMGVNNKEEAKKELLREINAFYEDFREKIIKEMNI